jgi:allophanate hydrolase subunit 1
VRGALEQLPGVRETEIAPGNRNVVVRYDPQQTTVGRMLEGLAAAGRPAKPK